MKLRFVRKENETAEIWSFWFEPTEALTWLAGQSIRLEIPRATFGVDERRFSISSAPYEKLIRITTRLSDSTFKQSLVKLETGAEIDGFAVEGDFVWKEDSRPKLFLAGGIGVTPFRSMLLQAVHDKQLINVDLVHSFHGDQVFKNELIKIQGLKNHQLKDRRISANWLNKNLVNWRSYNVYISGPEKMVKELGDDLMTAQLNPDNLLLDLFTGNL